MCRSRIKGKVDDTAGKTRNVHQIRAEIRRNGFHGNIIGIAVDACRRSYSIRVFDFEIIKIGGWRSETAGKGFAVGAACQATEVVRCDQRLADREGEFATRVGASPAFHNSDIDYD